MMLVKRKSDLPGNDRLEKDDDGAAARARSELTADC